MQKLKKIILMVLISLGWLLLFEAGSHYWLKNYGSHYEQALLLLTPDPSLGWRQKSNLRTKFLNSEVHTNSHGFREKKELEEINEDPLQVLIMGPSSSFGWGVPSTSTYAKYLQKLLSNDSGRKVLVYNMGLIGSSSTQGLQLAELYKEALKKFDILVLAYGVNDIDRHRFFFDSLVSDSEQLSRITSLDLVTQKLFFSSAFSLLLKKIISTTRPSSHLPLLSEKRRVPLKRSLSNLQQIAKVFLRDSSHVILLNTPHRFPGYPGFDQLSRADEIYRRAVAAYQLEDWETALSLFQESLQQEALKNESHYYLARIYQQMGQVARAQKEFSLARQTEKHRLHRDISQLNRSLLDLAEKEHFSYVDAHDILQGKGHYFLDPVHPSRTGHQEIARQLSAVIKRQRDERK